MNTATVNNVTEKGSGPTLKVSEIFFKKSPPILSNTILPATDTAALTMNTTPRSTILCTVALLSPIYVAIAPAVMVRIAASISLSK